MSKDHLRKIGKLLKDGAAVDGTTLTTDQCLCLMEWIVKTDDYITVLRQRIYGRADGKHVGDWDLDRAGQHCILGMEAIRSPAKL
jgi:hypothetical protein